ncbi:AAA family ATPase [Kribbella shirazensis]|uniref:DNA-binding CsgD family transcriptional regulator n=1 Tax=Kribbella shirazensis TaxID=1105143 RepID=A0A7X6A5J3_9ACTN|nr:LuxR family transcriptional regulator [Kribbella shirazensis]NIK61324.1 DNA-binding CsgD family transcriptional regulator [Kribbella shirazensis]
MPTEHPAHGLLGRHAECRFVDRLLDTVRSGQSQVVVLRGEPGIGKSALLEYTQRGASGCRVARVTGVEYETELAYAGLHQLCAPFLPLKERLPAPQRDALDTAFGLSPHGPSDRFVVALAALALLAEAAEERPLLCVIDDAQWLDRESLLTIAFVARRLYAESVGMVLAVRQSSELRELAGLPELALSGLDYRESRALIDAAWPGRLDERVRDRVIAESRGNPLALLEFPKGLTPAEFAGGYQLPDAAPVATQIERSFRRQVESLPADTRQLMLTAAAEPMGDVTLLWRSAAVLGLARDAAEAAQRDGLIELGTHVRFRHPLVRSAIYRAASASDRLQVHAALAAAIDAGLEPDRATWHRGHATTRLDESVADQLEQSAERARARGGVAAAAAFLERAAELTPDPRRRGRRILAAARARFAAGAFAAATALLALAEGCPMDDLDRALIARLRAQITFVVNRGVDAPGPLLAAAERLAPLDAETARDTYLEALGATLYAGRLHGAVGAYEIAVAARNAFPERDGTRPTDLLLDGLATRFTDGYVAAVRPLRQALDAFAVADDNDVLSWFWLPWLVAGDLWDDLKWHDLAAQAVRLCRETGALTSLPLALGYRAVVHVHAGEFAAASALMEEGNGIAQATGGAAVNYPPMLLAAWRGVDPKELLEAFRVDLEDATARGETRWIGGSGYLNALLHNAVGRHDVALASAREACEYDDLGLYGFALVELVEAAARSGARDEAAAALRQVRERTSAAGTDWALGVQAWSRALLSERRTAEGLYREAIERLEQTRVPLHLGRARLLYGEWLRQESRRTDARHELHAANELFSQFGAEAYGERARRELVAAGGAAHSRSDRALGLLTSQESQIARLARDGLSNSEIGAELYISRHTVDWHLRKVFAKLEITSRKELGTLPLSRLESA